jgi:hypothetical protein
MLLLINLTIYELEDKAKHLVGQPSTNSHAFLLGINLLALQCLLICISKHFLSAAAISDIHMPTVTLRCLSLKNQL